MKDLGYLAMMVLLTAGGCVRAATPAPRSVTDVPVRIIFDTDMDTDCDDAGALAMLHALADDGEVEILATPVSSAHPWSPAAVDAINTYFGRPDLPIGVPKAPGLRDFGSRYARQIAHEFPQDIGSGARVPDAVEVYRRVLAAQPDTSVVVVTVGDVTNIRHLLESRPDRHSPLDGVELARRKVRRWVAMGGTFPAHTDPRVFGNFKPDAQSTVIAVGRWPGPLVFAGDEIGDHILTGATLADTPASNPVRRAYELYFGVVGKQRPSWDQTALLHAVRPHAGYWREVAGWRNHIFDNGTSEWRSAPGSPHRYLAEARPAEEITAAIERLMTRTPSTR
jgi:inosine-uridine nucleoside N-ribohydrolase